MSKPAIQAVFFDVDGTLLGLNSDRVSNATAEALAILKAKGIKIFVSTGRTYEHSRFLAPHGFDGYITFNGSYCVDADGTPSYRRAIDRVDMIRLNDYLTKVSAFPVGVMTSAGTFISDVTEEVSAMYGLLKLNVPEQKSFSAVLDHEILQLNLFVDEEKEHHLITEIMVGCESSRWCPEFADINAKGINKWVGMQKFLDKFAIDPAAAMAFGDGGNDIKMLEMAGIGVAMGDAGGDVKKVADYVTGTADENGIWNALKAYQII